MSEHFSSITCALVISLIILFFILLIYVIKAIREHSDAKTYYSYVPKFPNEIVEKYYYQIYEIIVTDFHVLHDRKKCKVYKYLIFICLILFGLFLILGGEIDFPPLLFLSFASLISSFVFAFLVFSRKTRIYKNVIPLLLNKLDKSYTYDESQGIPSEEYNKVYSLNYTRYTSNDLITGNISIFPFKMSEVYTENSYTDKDGNTHYNPIFSGALFIVDLSSIIKDPKNIVDVLHSNPSSDYEVKLLDDKMYIGFKIGCLFNFYFSDEIEESLNLAESFYNIDYMIEIVDKYINIVIDKNK